MNLGSLIIEIGTNLANLHTGLREASGALSTWASQTQKRLKPFEDSALMMGAAFGAISVAAGVAVKSFGDFQAKLNGVASVSGATAAEIEQVRVAAMKMGADTQFSAAEAADGFYELGKAGFSVKEQLDTMPGVVNLAAAAQVSIGEAAATTAGILRGFGLAATEAGKVADELAKAANASAVDVSDLSEAMKYIAPIARGSGQTLEEMNGILAVLGNNMIKGSQAGTSIRSMLVALQKPSDDAAAILAKLGISIQDTHGKMLPLTDIVAQMREKMAGYTETQKSAALAQIFGQESLSSVMALMNQAPGSIEKMVTSMKRADGAAQEMADGLNKGVNFQFQQLQGSIETVGIKFGQDLAPAIEGIVGLLTNFVNLLGDVPGPVRTLVLIVGGLTAAVTALAASIGAFSSFVIPQAVAGFEALGISVNVASAGVRGFIAAWGPWALIATGVILAIAGIQSKLDGLNKDLDDTIAKNNALAAASGKVALAGDSAWAKYSKGLKLTKEEAKAALLHIRSLQTEAFSAGNSATGNSMKAKADALQAMINSGDLASSGPQRGAAVVDPNAAKKAQQAAQAAARAAAKGLQGRVNGAQAQLDNALAANATNGGGVAGQLKAYEAYRKALVAAGADTKKIAEVNRQIAQLHVEQGKAIAKQGLDKIETQLKQNLALNERFKGGIAGQINAYQTYLGQLKQMHVSRDKEADQAQKIAETEQKIADLKQQQIDKTNELINKGKQAAFNVLGLGGEGMKAADQGGVGATPGFLAQNASQIAQMPQMLMDMAKGLQAALPALSSALPALAPMFEALSTALGSVIAGGLAPLIPIVAAIVAALTIFMLAWQTNAGGIQQAFGNLMTALGSLWESVVGFLQPLIDLVGTVFAQIFNQLAIFFAIIGTVIDVMNAIRDAIWNAIMSFGPLKWIIDGISWVFQGLWDAIVDLINWVRTVILRKDPLKFEKAGSKQSISESSADKRAIAESNKQLSLPSQIGQAVAQGVGEVMGQFTSFNPLPVEDMSKANALFSQGPSGRWFVSQETRATIDLNLKGDVDADRLIAAVQNPQVRAALSDAVGREAATVNLIPRFA